MDKRSYSDGLMAYNPRVGSIEGSVESDGEKAARLRRAAEQRDAELRRETRMRRKEIATKCKTTLRELEAARREYRLLRWALVGSASFATALVVAWVGAVTWGVATNLTGGRGGPFTLYIVGLVVLTIVDAVALIASAVGAHDTHGRVVKATHAHADALEASVDYENELTNHEEGG